jgi:ribosomal protein S18 acetylase RimI-like enzyme
MDLDDVTIRAPTPDDVPRIAALVAEGFDTYRSFAPPGWAPPPMQEHERYLVERLWNADTWARLAERGDTIAGVVSMTPTATSRRPVADPGLAHLWQFFIAREWWGTGLATRLHALVVEAAGTRGFTSMRLFTPADQARARRFYEREGWRLAATDEDDEIGFPVVEYRLDLA